MKFIKNISQFEAIVNRDWGSLTDEEIVENDFKMAAENGESSPYAENNLRTFFAWTKVSNKYRLYDDYFFYDNCILQYSCRPSGNWYSHSLTRLDIKPSEFRKKIEEKIRKMEDAIEKIDYGITDES